MRLSLTPACRYGICTARSTVRICLNSVLRGWAGCTPVAPPHHRQAPLFYSSTLITGSAAGTVAGNKIACCYQETHTFIATLIDMLLKARITGGISPCSDMTLHCFKKKKIISNGSLLLLFSSIKQRKGPCGGVSCFFLNLLSLCKPGSDRWYVSQTNYTGFPIQAYAGFMHRQHCSGCTFSLPGK